MHPVIQRRLEGLVRTEAAEVIEDDACSEERDDDAGSTPIWSNRGRASYTE